MKKIIYTLIVSFAALYNVNAQSTLGVPVATIATSISSSEGTSLKDVAVPYIASNPVAVYGKIVIVDGSTITFSIANSKTTYSYQWQKELIDIVDANSSTYALTNVTGEDCGNYSCRVRVSDEDTYYTDSITLIKMTLPVNLLSFIAQAEDNITLTKWSTASETNNDYYTVQRSKDGITFEEVLKMQGAGNSNTVLNYSAIDDNPYNGVSYYRLMQTDFDGKYTYSNIVAVNFAGLITDNANIYPNPFNTNISIMINEASQINNYELKIYNVSGVEVMNKIVTKQSITI